MPAWRIRPKYRMPLKDRPRLFGVMPGALMYRVEPSFVVAELDVTRQVRCLDSTSFPAIPEAQLQVLVESIAQTIARRAGIGDVQRNHGLPSRAPRVRRPPDASFVVVVDRDPPRRSSSLVWVRLSQGNEREHSGSTHRLKLEGPPRYLSARY